MLHNTIVNLVDCDAYHFVITDHRYAHNIRMTFRLNASENDKYTYSLIHKNEVTVDITLKM